MANSKQNEAEILLNVVCSVVLWYLCNSVMLSVHYHLFTMTHQSKTGNWYIVCYLEYGNKSGSAPHPYTLPHEHAIKCFRHMSDTLAGISPWRTCHVMQHWTLLKKYKCH